MPGDNRAIEKLTRKNSLFLSAAAQNNHALLSPIFAWFSKSLSFIASREDLMSEVANGFGEGAFKGRIVKMMEAADLGITDIRVEQETPPEQWKDAMTAFLKVLVPDVQNVTDGRRNVVKLTHQMGDNSRAFSLADESNGTIAYLALLGPVLKALEKGGTLCVDELASSLHPNLTIELMKMFQQSSSNAQLIFNTHDTNLLGGSLLRRDQIWFTEKKPDGSSSLYPLTDFSPRQHENLEGGYLQGRSGAVPFLNPEGLSKLVGRGDDGN
jgi:AAA15 family ATPase/GTPase